MVRPVNEFAGSYDVHLASGQRDEWVGFEIHKVEGNLRDFGDGAVPHEVWVRRGVQYVGFTIYCTCKHTHTHTHTQSKWLGKNQRG